LACAGLIGTGVAEAQTRPPTCSAIEDTAYDLRENLEAFADAVSYVEPRTQTEWLARVTARYVNAVVDDAIRIHNIWPRNDNRCAANIQRFRNFTERQICPRLRDLRTAFRNDPHLAADVHVFRPLA
jgi:hypothetical protein